MDSKELRQLCDQVQFSSDTLQSDLARSCLALLDENEAMRVVVKAAEMTLETGTWWSETSINPSPVHQLIDAINALDKLGERK